MEAEGKSIEQLKLEQVCVGVKKWRETRPKLGPMPAELWDDAAAVARELGVYPVARALGVNYKVLKERVAPAPKEERRAQLAEETAVSSDLSRKRNDFIEVSGIPLLSEPRSEGTTVVEVVAADGARLTIRLQGKSQADVAGLVTAFQERRR